MIIFAADDPLVLNGTYDREGYKPGERARIAKARARRAETAEEIAMKKTKKPDRTKHKPAVRLTGPTGEVLFEGTDSEFKSAAKQARLNSQDIAPETVSVGEAMRRAVEQLGSVTIDDQLAAAQMEELANAFEQVEREKAAFLAKSEAAKTAKKALESATEFLLERVKTFTHPVPLPLFDETQAEEDREAMLDAADVDDVEVDEGDEVEA